MKIDKYLLSRWNLVVSLLVILQISWFSSSALAQNEKFRVAGNKFEMNGHPYQVRSGEIDFQRIPKAYWGVRLKMAKAMGLNTIATYIFWDQIEPEPGIWDFTGDNNVRKFITIAKKDGLNVILRPGPYVCGEHDFGGLPPWLLRIPNIKVRCSNPQYMEAVKQYIKKIGDQLRNLQNSHNGPIILWQIENEYGSYGNDKIYMNDLVRLWKKAGIDTPFFTADGAAKSNILAGSLPGLAIGLDPGTNKNQYKLVEHLRPGVPIFCSEYYPGWLTHWREKWAKVPTKNIIPTIKWFMKNHKSFNLYMFNGGTNFGFMTGSNYGNKFEPDVTSYDYDAPLNEMGQPRKKYFAIRKAIQQFLPGHKLPAVPKAPKGITIPAISFTEGASLWHQLPKAIHVAQPRPMEAFKQNYGYILYQTKLIGATSGLLKIIDLHDYATIFLDGKYIGKIDRSLKQNTIRIPKISDPNPTLDILVEAMGRINFGSKIIDRKGITKRVLLNYMTLMNWKVYCLPMNNHYLNSLKFTTQTNFSQPGAFFKATFHLNKVGETYLDMSKWKKGVVWVNGHNLGRYWYVGPQTRLYCPGSWLKKGKNTIVVFDMLQTTPAEVSGVRKLYN